MLNTQTKLEQWEQNNSGLLQIVLALVIAAFGDVRVPQEYSVTQQY